MQADLDYFQIFDLPRRHDLGRDEIEARYLELSRAAHPDNLAADATSGERRRAVERASEINAAYRALRDPVARAEHLVKLAGIDLDSSDPQLGAPHPTQAFLIEMIELRERLADASPAEIPAIRDEVEARADASLDAAVAAIDAGDVQAAAEHLVARRYFQRFMDEAETHG